MRNKYDTAVVFLYAMGKEHILPLDFRRKIPYPTISTWRKMDYSKYMGHEFRYLFEDAFTNAELSYKYHQLKKGMLSVARAWIELSGIVRPALKDTKNDKSMKDKVLRAINYLTDYLGRNRSLRLFGLSRTLYQQWLLESRFDCFDSFTALCAKRHPHQLELKEVEKMKKMLLDPSLNHWPIVSIQAFAFRNQSITASLCSWYKYAGTWGIRRELVRRKMKIKGLPATYPNEYLHADTTYYPMLDGSNVCISFVMDNYSRMILGWHVGKEFGFEVLVKHALIKAIKMILTHPQQKASRLVTDGGREYNNNKMDHFLSGLKGHKMTKIVALKDITFSNSPVEAIHRTMKGRYLCNRA